MIRKKNWGVIFSELYVIKSFTRQARGVTRQAQDRQKFVACLVDFGT